MSKSRLGRLKKDELMGMLQERGIAAEGRKQQLVDLIWEHDYGEDASDMERGSKAVMVSNQAAAVKQPRVAVREVAPEVVVQQLQDRIDALNGSLAAVRSELEANSSEHDQNRAVVEQTIEQLEALKHHWASKLEEMGVRVEAAVKQQVSQEEVLSLRDKLSGLEEHVATLERLQSAREDEIQSLRHSLEALRAASATAEQSRKEEQIALLALAGQAMSAAPTAPPAVPSWAFPGAAWPSEPTASPAKQVTSHPLSAPAAPVPKGNPSVSTVQRMVGAAGKDGSRVYGMALPDLAAVYALRIFGNGCLTSYLAVRNAATKDVRERQLVDIASAVALCLSLTAAL